MLYLECHDGKMGNLNILGDGCPRWSLWDGCFVLSFFSFFALVSIFGFGLLSLANEESLVPAGDSLLLEIFFILTEGLKSPFVSFS